MASNQTVVVQRSFPIVGVLGLIFITLKLCSVIAWSWWWVLAPFWIPVAIVLTFIAACAFVALAGGAIVFIAHILKAIVQKKK